jgi:hypothetical protein
MDRVRGPSSARPQTGGEGAGALGESARILLNARIAKSDLQVPYSVVRKGKYGTREASASRRGVNNEAAKRSPCVRVLDAARTELCLILFE